MLRVLTRQVVEERGVGCSWLELLHRTNELLCAWSAARPEALQLPSMEISSTCRGAPFGPADLAAPPVDAGPVSVR